MTSKKFSNKCNFSFEFVKPIKTSMSKKRKNEEGNNVEKKSRSEEKTLVINGEVEDYSLVHKKVNSNSLEILVTNAQLISIETKEKTRDELVENISKFLFLLGKIPDDVKIYLISFIDVQLNFRDWWKHEELRILGINKKTGSIYRDLFGYFQHDKARKPIFLFENISFTDVPFQEKDFFSETTSNAIYQTTKNVMKFTPYIDYPFGEVLWETEGFLDLLKHSKVRESILSFDKCGFEVFQSLKHDYLRKLTIYLDSILDFTLPKEVTYNFKNLKEIIVDSQKEPFEIQDNIKFLFNRFDHCHLKSIFFGCKSLDLLFDILKSQKKLSKLTVYCNLTNEQNLHYFLSKDIDELTVYIDTDITTPFKFHPSLKDFSLIIGGERKDILRNFVNLKNIKYLKVQYYNTLETLQDKNNFLKLCDKHGIELQTNFYIKEKKDFKNITFRSFKMSDWI